MFIAFTNTDMESKLSKVMASQFLSSFMWLCQKFTSIIYKTKVLSKIARAPFIKALYVQENHVGLVGSRTFVDNYGDGFTEIQGLALSALSCPLAHVTLCTKQITVLPLAEHRWAPSICQGQFKFHLLHEALSDCANQSCPSFELFTPPLRSMCVYMHIFSQHNSLRAGNMYLFYSYYILIFPQLYHIYTQCIVSTK